LIFYINIEESSTEKKWRETIVARGDSRNQNPVLMIESKMR